jgi:hypothetical protein
LKLLISAVFHARRSSCQKPRASNTSNAGRLNIVSHKKGLKYMAIDLEKLETNAGFDAAE